MARTSASIRGPVKSNWRSRVWRSPRATKQSAFAQDKQAIEQGLFNTELPAEEMTQVRMGKIVKERFPNLDEEDQEAVRQHAVAALNLVQQAKKILTNSGVEPSENTALIDGVR